MPASEAGRDRFASDAGRGRPVAEEQQFDDTDRVAAFLQELRAGTVPISEIVPLAVELAERRATGVRAPVVPVLCLPLMSWSEKIVGDPLVKLIHLLEERGGIWIAARTTAQVEWTVGPVTGTEGTAAARGGELEPWFRADLDLRGPWSARFAVSAAASTYARYLRHFAVSPILGVLPREVADRALPARKARQSLAEFTSTLDNFLHFTVTPSESIRRLVVNESMPGHESLK